MKIKKISQWNKWMSLTLFMMALLSVNVWATEDPIQLLNGITKKVMSELKANRQAIQSNRSKLYSVVDQLILPHVDFVEMGRWVVGRNAWTAADEDTQKTFVNEFKKLVVGSYAGSLLGYTNQTIEFLPLRGSSNQKRIQVSSLIKESGKAPLRLDYRLIREDDSWKVYDIIIEGVSLASGYRAQFADTVRQGGLEAVVQSLRNRRGRDR